MSDHGGILIPGPMPDGLPMVGGPPMVPGQMVRDPNMPSKAEQLRLVSVQLAADIMKTALDSRSLDTQPDIKTLGTLVRDTAAVIFKYIDQG